MQLTPTITFHGVDRTAALEEEVIRRVRKLETYYPRIIGCRVLVDLVQRHHESGNRYEVRVDLTVPGEEIVVTHDAGLHATAQDLDAQKMTKSAESDPERKHARVAIRAAFDVARRRLQDYARRQRGSIKTSARQARGRVTRIFPIDDYGYIQAAEDGHEVYFQRSSVLDDEFDGLAVGSVVTFAETSGDKGPQASTVRVAHPRRVHHASRAAGARLVR